VVWMVYTDVVGRRYVVRGDAGMEVHMQTVQQISNNQLYGDTQNWERTSAPQLLPLSTPLCWQWVGQQQFATPSCSGNDGIVVHGNDGSR